MRDAVRPRAGRSFYSSADTAAYTGNVYRLADGTGVVAGALYATDGSKLYEVKSGAIASAAVTPNSGLGVDICVFGTPATGSRVYLSDSNGLRRYAAGAFTNIGATTTPKGGFLAISIRDARLVCANCAINATPVSSRVHFSDAGAPETWTTTNFVDLNPGDGEVITGVCPLGDNVIVFKQTRAYVFYGASTSGTGTPVFNYRTVNLGDYITAGNLTSGRFSCDGEAIYYVASRGLYRMTGDSPTLISQDALGDALVSGGYISPSSAYTLATMDKIYVGDGAGGSLVVLEKATGDFSLYTTIASALLDAKSPRAAYAYDTTADRLTTFDPTLYTDLGSTLSATYSTAEFDCGTPNQKRVRRAWAQGRWLTSSPATMTLRMNVDGTLGGVTTTLAEASGTAPQFLPQSAQGYTYSLIATGTGPWLLYRLGFDLEDAREA